MKLLKPKVTQLGVMNDGTVCRHVAHVCDTGVAPAAGNNQATRALTPNVGHTVRLPKWHSPGRAGLPRGIVGTFWRLHGQVSHPHSALTRQTPARRGFNQVSPFHKAG
ncbi:hypothetical protein ETAA8_54090 [Anatilimnocola aggregata]|uniref:Uncharacterized protein n=1 Tax=Anatilimnocola aggregata TaxID=2528021 RepID=A0A517YJ88_9BACT|nr:hypothetical protein ETAA8_54090 [Anatilimnocola aggregata]